MYNNDSIPATVLNNLPFLEKKKNKPQLSKHI